MPDRHAPVAIIGGGFSGTMVAANLARRGVHSILIEPRDVAGKGTAFSTEDPAHLLNVHAGNMSAWPDRAEDYSSRAGGPGSFAERRHFGAYLREILDEALDSGRTELIGSRATSATRNGWQWRVALENGESVEADAVVLAIGNQPPAQLPFGTALGDRLVDNPWGDKARAAIEDSAARQLDVLIVGTGLTMVDVMLSLDSAGHKGRIVALSRRGLVPKSHDSYEEAPVGSDELPVGNARRIIRWLRERTSKVGWRAAVDSLRPHSHALWQSLPPEQQRLFLRHARPWWDVHRHRIAPQVGARLQALLDDGRLQIVAGRVLDSHRSDGEVAVTIRRRGADSADSPQRFGYIFNCTGPLSDIGRTEDPLLRQLLDDGLVLPDELSIGLEVDQRSRAAPGERLWALGTLTKGRYWEIIAVPDIRHQAAAVAEDIATELGQ
jgi:uncharacterized NAD(P)/FAD-binding protein YdhS